MNICIANTQEFNPLIGGVERVSSILAQEWIALGHKVIFVAQIKSRYSTHYVSVAMQYFLPNQETADSFENQQFLNDLIVDNNIEILINQAANLSGFTKLCTNTCANLSGVSLTSVIHFAPFADLIIQGNNFFIYQQLGFKISQWLRQLLLNVRFNLYRKKQLLTEEQSYYKHLCRWSDAVVMLSDNFKSVVQDVVDKDSAQKVVAFSNPINNEQINLSIDDKRKQLLYVGRLIYGQKRVDRLIKIWDKLYKAYPQWELVIVGDGDYRYSFEKMVSDREIPNVRFEGFKEPEEYMSQAAILCMTSSTEGFGMVLVEAQQHGCVPIAYDSFGSVRDIIEDGKNGVLVKPFSQKEYVAKLRQLMDDKELRQQMASNGLESVKRFDSQKIARQWIELFENIRK